MRKALLAFGLLALCTVPAGATSFGLPNDLVNPGFETGALPPWYVSQGSCDGAVGQGAWSLPVLGGGGQYMCGSTASYGTKNGTIAQVIPPQLPPFEPKFVDISGWVLTSQVGGGDGDVMVFFDIHQYGNLLWESPAMSTGGVWQYFEYEVDPEVTGLLCDEFIVTVRFQQNWALQWNHTYVDNMDVETYCIPEPGTMVLLGSGLTGLVAFVRRRRR
jgi:hypothetical protein